MVSVMKLTDGRIDENINATGYVRIQKKGDFYKLKVIVYVPIDYDEEDYAEVKKDSRIVCFAGSYHEDNPLASSLIDASFEIDTIKIDIDVHNTQIILVLKIKYSGALIWINLINVEDSVYEQIPIDAQYDSLIDEDDLDEYIQSIDMRINALK